MQAAEEVYSIPLGDYSTCARARLAGVTPGYLRTEARNAKEVRP